MKNEAAKNEKIIQKLFILFLASLNQNVDTYLNREIKVQGMTFYLCLVYLEKKVVI